MINDYYKILNVTPSSSLEDIKKAYKKLALQFHPDINPGEEEYFKLINEAYDFLSKNHEPNTGKEYLNNLFSEMFSEIFRSNKKVKAKQFLNLDISFEEAFYGFKKTLNIFLDVPCTNCSIITRKECRICNGVGFIKKNKKEIFTFPEKIYQNQMFFYKDFYENIDLVIKINILLDNVFKVKGKIIESEEQLNVFQGIMGGIIPVKTPQGIIDLEISPNQVENFNYILKDGGLGGDHIVKFKLYLPENLTPEHKRMLETILNETKNKDQQA